MKKPNMTREQWEAITPPVNESMDFVEEQIKTHLKHNQKDNPLNYVSKWIKQMRMESEKAEGYTAGEKQVVEMNLHKIQVELEVARLIQKDFLRSFASTLIERVGQEVLTLTADEINGDYTDEEKKNPLVAYNSAIKAVCTKLQEMR